MGRARVRMPMVEVVAPDGRWELWAAAVERSRAVSAVQQTLPVGYVAKPSSQRLSVSSRMGGCRYGEVRKVRP